jgi:hypothetical protein
MSEPYRVLLAAMHRAPPGSTWSVDTWRTEADLAQLTSLERGQAQTRAVDEGYLTPLGAYRDGRWLPLCDRTTHAKGKGRWVQVLERTDRPLPGQVCEGQAELFEMSGGAF